MRISFISLHTTRKRNVGKNTEEKDYVQFVGCFIHKIDYQLI